MSDKKMFRISVNAEEKAIIKQKADDIALSTSAYAKMVLNELKEGNIDIIKDITAPTLREKPKCIMVALSDEQSEELKFVADKANVYMSEWFRWVLVNVDVELHLKL